MLEQLDNRQHCVVRVIAERLTPFGSCCSLAANQSCCIEQRNYCVCSLSEPFCRSDDWHRG